MIKGSMIFFLIRPFAIYFEINQPMKEIWQSLRKFKLNQKSLPKTNLFFPRMMRKIWMTKLRLWRRTPPKQKLMGRIKKIQMAMVERKRKIVV